MTKEIVLASPILGFVDIIVKENENYRNTFEIGDKRIDFSPMLPKNLNLHNVDSYRIIIKEGFETSVLVQVFNFVGRHHKIVKDTTYEGKLKHCCVPRTEETKAVL